MTNEEKIRKEIATTENLAKRLIYYNDYYGEFFTSDCESFENQSDAVKHEIDWLRQENKK